MASTSAPASAAALTPLQLDGPRNKHHEHGRYADLSMGRTYCELIGPEDGQPTVLVHGLTIWSFYWADLVDCLVDAGLQVLIYDLLGRGHSDAPSVNYNEDLFVNQLSELIDDVFGSNKAVNLVGYSLGGAIAATYTSRHTTRVRSLILMAPAGAGAQVPAVAQLLKVPFLGKIIFNNIGPALMLRRLENEGIASEFVNVEAVGKEAIEAVVEKLRWMIMNKSGFPDAFFSTMTQFNMATLYLEWSKIPSTVPVLLLWPEKDNLVPFANHTKVLSVIPHAELMKVENAGHGFLMEVFPLLSNAIRSFFVEQSEDSS